MNTRLVNMETVAEMSQQNLNYLRLQLDFNLSVLAKAVTNGMFINGEKPASNLKQHTMNN